MSRLSFVVKVNGTGNPYRDSLSGEITGTRHDRKLQVHKLLAAECRRLEAEGFGVVLAGDINIARSALDGHPNLRVSPIQHSINRADFESRFLSDAVIPQVTPEHTSTSATLPIEESLRRGLGMIDTFRSLHPETRSYTYYPRGKTFGDSCDRVDMILISVSLKNNLIEAGMHETPGDRGPSDHVPLFARLDFN